MKLSRKVTNLIFLIPVITFAITKAQAETFDALNIDTAGIDALNYKRRSDFTASTNTVMVDAEIDSLGTQSVTYDRTLFNQSRLGGNYVLGPKIGVRWRLQSLVAMRVQEGKEEPREISREQWTEARPRLDLTFLGENNVELFGGVTYFYLSAIDRKTVSTTVDTSWHFNSITMPIPHVGIVKRASAFEGGVIYKMGVEKSRKIDKKTTTVAEESYIFEDKVHDPAEIGLFGSMNFGANKALLEFTAISAGEGGTQTDNGDSVTEDYTRLRLGVVMPSLPIPMDISLVHRTLSYADNRNVTVSMIPMTALHWKFLFGNADNHTFLGMILGYGYDKQSIPEFNANYKVGAYGVSAGMNMVL